MRYERKIAPLQKKSEKDRALYDKLLREATKAKNRDEIEALRSEASDQHRIMQFEIDSVVTGELTREAELLFVPIPPRSDEKYWRESWLVEEIRHLTPEGVQLLRDAIRDERKKRREVRFGWIEIVSKIVALATGLIGAVIGLVATLKK